MKRLHINVGVEDVAKSIAFYNNLFNEDPSVTKDDYAKWMLEDPRINFSISLAKTSPKGVDHLGFQADTPDELAVIAERLKAADQVTFDQDQTVCCYAQSDKTWVQDPDGVTWENFYTYKQTEEFGQGPTEEELHLAAERKEKVAESTSCCG